MKIAPRDEWGNVRVPHLEALQTGGRDHSKWMAVPSITQPEQWSSLVGVPVVGLPPASTNLTADFSLESSYMTLKCDRWETFSRSDERLASYKNEWGTDDPFGSGGRGLLGSSHVSDTNITTTFFLDGDMPYAARQNATAAMRDSRPRRLYFVSARRPSQSKEYTLSAIKCSLAQIAVEVAVQCPTLRECKATKVRRSLANTRAAGPSTPLDATSRRSFFFFTLPFVEKTSPIRSSMTELFLRDSVELASVTPQAPYVNLADVPPPVFARRLQLVLNTWFQLTLATESAIFYGDNPADPAAYGFDFGRLPANGSVAQPLIEHACRLFCTRSTGAVLARSAEVFTYSRVWLALLFASAGVLVAAGLAGFVVGWKTRTPDMLGYVASMTYNNAFLPLPSGGGVLDAMERARILRDLRVSISDVKGADSTGCLAFTSYTDVRPLGIGRQYK